MIHLKRKNHRKTANERFNLLFSLRFVLVPSKVSIAPACKSKERRTTWRRKKHHQRALLSWQIIRLSSLVMKPLVWSLPGVSSFNFTFFYLSFSLKKNWESFKLILFFSTTRGNDRIEKKAEHKEGSVETRIINQPRREREIIMDLDWKSFWCFMSIGRIFGNKLLGLQLNFCRFNTKTVFVNIEKIARTFHRD